MGSGDENGVTGGICSTPSHAKQTPEMLKLCRVTEVKVFFLLLVYAFNFNLF